MEVSSRTLAWLTALAVCVGWVALFGTRPFHLRHREDQTAEQLARSSLRDSVFRLGLQVRTEATMARAESALAGVPQGRRPIVVSQNNWGAATSLAESLFASIPQPESPAVSTRVVLLDDPSESRLPSGTLTSFAVVPDPGSDGACTIVHMVFRSDTTIDQSGAERWSWTPWDGAVGPCWFLARFGPPGPQVRAWLDARYWDVAASIPPVPHDPAPLEGAPEVGGWLARLFGDLRSTFYNESIVSEGCAGRRPQLCEAAFLRTSYPTGLLPKGVVGNQRLAHVPGRAPINWMVELPSSATGRLLAAMVDDLGPATFRRFWTSEAPVAEAFHAAAGMTLGDWYRIQLRREMQTAGLPAPSDAPVWPSMLGFLALALGGTIWLGARRQVR